jgi:steroid delta-isomerase-like uncharacterized protein
MVRVADARNFATEEARMNELVRKVVDAYNNHKVEDFDELLTDDCVIVRNGVEARGRDAVKAVVGRLFRALPDVHYEIDDVVMSGDKLALRWRGRGTSRGDYFGVPANGQELLSEGITLYELREGRVARIYVSANLIGRPTQPEARA